MTSRFLALVFVAGSLALGATGCNGGASGGGPAGDANLDSLATGDAGDQIAYNLAFGAGQQARAQDSTFSFERFRDGFRAGLRGDSAELAYASGIQAGFQFYADSVARLDPNIFLTGFREGLQGDSTRLTEEQVSRATSAFQDTIQVRQLRTRAASDPQAQAQLGLIRANGEAAERFLAQVAGRSGVRRTASGMLYTITTPGTGASPSPSDRVRIRYVGKLADGTTFDQSPGTEAVELPIAAVVPGFAEALQAMKVGETRTIWLPPNLAYGLQGAPSPDGQGGIPPNSALEFQLTLVEIVQGGSPIPQGAFVPPSAQ